MSAACTDRIAPLSLSSEVRSSSFSIFAIFGRRVTVPRLSPRAVADNMSQATAEK
jgi:hypothetical protein